MIKNANYKILSRRDFLKKTGRFLVASSAMLTLESILSGCATFDPNKGWSQLPPEEFDIKGFDRWFRWKKLYNGVNPNLRWPHGAGNYPTFRDCAWSPIGANPGIDYGVPHGEVMVAAAPGEVYAVFDLATLNAGRAGGMVVSVGHPYKGRGTTILPPFVSDYAHLDKVFVKTGDNVERGEPIGNVTEHNRYAKLLFSEGIGTKAKELALLPVRVVGIGPWIPRVPPRIPKAPWIRLIPKGLFFLPQVNFLDEDIGVAIVDFP